MSKWHKVEEELPKKGGHYLCLLNAEWQGYEVLVFTKDAYKTDEYDFAEYKGKHKALFYDYDSEYGYFECNPIAWCEIPKYTEEEETDYKELYEKLLERLSRE